MQQKCTFKRKAAVEKSNQMWGKWWNAIFGIVLMKTSITPALEQALKAFTYHEVISIRKKDGHHIAPGYIIIMYGDTAFRMQSALPDLDSHFVSISDIDEILIGEEHSSLSL